MAIFVDPKQAEKYECSICLDIFEEPVQMGCENHVFCKKCITDLIPPETEILKCPTCRYPCDVSSIINVKFIQRNINSLLVKCSNKITSEKAAYLENIQINKSNKNVRRSKRLKQRNGIDLLNTNNTQTISGKKRKIATNSNSNKKLKLNQEQCQ
eukprot:41790_1